MKRCERYKPSGIEWIGEIPEHWKVLPATKYFQSVIDYRGKTPVKTDSGVFLVTTRNIREGKIDYENSQEFVSEEGYYEIMSRGLPKVGDLLFTMEAPLGEVAVVDREKVALAQRIVKFRVKEFILNPYFVKYSIMGRYFQNHLQSLATGSTALGLKASKLHMLRIITPTLSEQEIIANYLGHKTAQIDDLIAKKERLIELLNEKKTTIINQAVTQGLNPNAPMKDSGIPWLAKMPAHWEAIRLKWISKINPSKGASDFNKDSNHLVTFLPMEKVFEDGSFDNSTKKAISELWSGFTYFEEGDVIAAKITPCFENGKGALLENLGSKIGFGSTEFHVLRPTDKVLPKFLFYLTRTKLFKSMGEALMYGAAGQKRVPTSFLEEYVLGLPPIEEQHNIIDYIDKSKVSIENAVLKIQHEIELLQEYRTALISEAVTGKIDVRGVN